MLLLLHCCYRCYTAAAVVTGEVTEGELEAASAAEEEATSTNFTCGSHFYEEVEDTKVSAASLWFHPFSADAERENCNLCVRVWERENERVCTARLCLAFVVDVWGGERENRRVCVSRLWWVCVGGERMGVSVSRVCAVHLWWVCGGERE